MTKPNEPNLFDESAEAMKAVIAIHCGFEIAASDTGATVYDFMTNMEAP
jgi:hypothetical protein